MEVFTLADDGHKLRRSNDCLDFMALSTSLRPIKASPLIYCIMHGAQTVNAVLIALLALGLGTFLFK